GFDTLIASGLSYDKAKVSSEAIAQATAVTGADSGILAKALVTGSSAFDIDLSKPGAAVDILQKMIVAGRLGNAELENLSSIFPKIGQDAKSAGMSMAQALSFVETLSLIELEPDRLGTLAQSTLRAFNNGAYRKSVTENTGVEFFNKDKSLRNTQDVFTDLQRKYKALKNDKDRAKFMDVVFGKMDQDTQKGVKAFLSGDRLENFASNTTEINGAKGVIDKDLADNMNSSTAVGTRMKATLGEAIDRMAKPLNKGFADMGSYLLDDLNLSGEELLLGGAALGVGGYYAGRGAKAGAGALLNKYMGGPDTLRNIAVGKVLEEAAGVTSVFVTNWPGGMALGGGMPDLPDSKPSGKGKPGGFVSPWLGPIALGGAATQIGGASPTANDEGRLDAVMRSKLLNDQER
ncbi:phage tail tape measure protein, partial [Pseudomonas qingdaonensis]|uniref:phage tail tape measure protein n=1 Tax=Pseudomonas qingdaonensis TaxID=2056231 RepID=UPI003690D9F1